MFSSNGLDLHGAILPLRHLCAGDLTEKKRGLYVGIPQSVKEFRQGEGREAAYRACGVFSRSCLTFTLQLGLGEGTVLGGPFRENSLSRGYRVESPRPVPNRRSAAEWEFVPRFCPLYALSPMFLKLESLGKRSGPSCG